MYPGLFSALGLLLADYRHDYVRSVALTLDKVDPATIFQQYKAGSYGAYRTVPRGSGAKRDEV